ncbi:hypothetical protein SAY87_015268 [Trapa incisa]|uniref:Rx N-terminal domain-containing protein n=1 Tax=Trapa incisa TaxID=236973 RepID=A0AAN7GXG1_9MYRT|nr:hypothetical protein SAY87_015268 [Trapa incisa]
MAELILGSFVDSLAGRVLSSLLDEIGLTRGVKLEFNKLVATLSLIRGYLQDAEKRQVDDEALKFWLKQLQDLAYETDDLLDDFNTEAIRRRSVAGGRKKMVNEVSIFFSSSNQLIYANRMAHRIKDLKEKLDFLRNLAGLFNLQSVSKSPSLVERHHRRPLTVSNDYEPYVIGRDEDTKYVVDFLLDPKLKGNLSILPIVGFGGLGKTTLAREVAVAPQSGSGASYENIPKEVRHVSMVIDMGVDRGSYNLKSLGPNQRIIRSLLFTNKYQHIISFSGEKTLNGDISSFRNLRALRLHLLAKGDVVRSIGKLKHLRSLDLSDSDKLTSLPKSIGKLLNLETLILDVCQKLESLPREVTKLANLRHLDMRGCDSLTCMPWGIGNLTNLEVLRGFRVEERGKSNAARMNELRRLTGLEELDIEYLERLEEESDGISTSDADYFWIDKSRLQRLHLIWGRRGADDPSEYAEEVLERLKPNLDLLKSFTIVEYPGTTLASWTGELHNLVEIILLFCDHLRSIPPLDQLPSLKSIDLSHCNNMRSIPPLDQLPSLKSIELKYLGELEWIEVTENSICLGVVASGRNEIQRFGGAVDEESCSISTTQMESLTLLPLSSVPLHKVTSLYLHHLDDTEELPMELFQSISSFQSLDITKCHHMRSIPPLDQFPSLRHAIRICLMPLSSDHISSRYIKFDQAKSYPSMLNLLLSKVPLAIKPWSGWGNITRNKDGQLLYGKTDGVVEDPVRPIIVGVGPAHDANHGEILTVSTGNVVEHAQAADSEGDRAGAHTLGPGISVGGVPCVQIVAAAYQVQPRLGQEVVVEREIEVPGNGEDVMEADLDVSIPPKPLNPNNFTCLPCFHYFEQSRNTQRYSISSWSSLPFLVDLPTESSLVPSKNLVSSLPNSLIWFE